MESQTAIVRALLDVAGLSVSATEEAALVSMYPAQRAMVALLYTVPMSPELEPQVTFSPVLRGAEDEVQNA